MKLAEPIIERDRNETAKKAAMLKINSHACLNELENLSEGRIEDNSDLELFHVLKKTDMDFLSGTGIRSVKINESGKFYVFGKEEDLFCMAVNREGGTYHINPCYPLDGTFVFTSTIKEAIRCTGR